MSSALPTFTIRFVMYGNSRCKPYNTPANTNNTHNGLRSSYRSTSPSVHWRCWLGGRKGIRPVKTEWWGAGVVICPSRCHCHSLSVASVKSRLVLPFRYRLTRVVPAKRAVKHAHVCVYIYTGQPVLAGIHTSEPEDSEKQIFTGCTFGN